MFLARNVSKELWAEAIGYAVYIQTAHSQAPEKSPPMRLLIVENPLSQTFASSGHLRLFTYLMLVARSWAQKRSKKSLLAVARSRKHTAYGLNQKGRLKSTEM
jgi:hypothetical protein